VYKLELINREDNYNKMFNSQPMVGVFNPLNQNAGTMGPGAFPQPGPMQMGTAPSQFPQVNVAGGRGATGKFGNTKKVSK